MNGIEIIILIVLIVAIAGGVGYFFSRNLPTLKEMKDTYVNKLKVNQAEEISKELYNKDLRPIAAKKAPKKKKQAPELEVVEAEFVEKVAKISKVLPEDATINLEAVRPSKKRRKYYSKQ